MMPNTLFKHVFDALVDAQIAWQRHNEEKYDEAMNRVVLGVMMIETKAMRHGWAGPLHGGGKRAKAFHERVKPDERIDRLGKQDSFLSGAPKV